MNRRVLHLSLLGFLAVSGFSQRLFAPTPPETQGLREIRPGVRQADEAFDKWLSAMQNGSSPLLLTESEYQKYARTLDEYTRLMWDVRRSTGSKESGARALKFLRAKEKDLKDSAMFPYLGQTLLDSGSLSLSESQEVERMLLTYGGSSCPRKRVVLKEMRGSEKSQLKKDEAVRFLAMIAEFRSPTFQEEALRTLLYRLDDGSMKDMRKEIVQAIAPFPRLVNNYPDLFDEKIELVQPGPVKAKTDLADRASKDEQCDKAQRELVLGIHEDKDKKFLGLVETSGSKLEACWRAKGDKNRLTYWEQMEAPLKERYGFLGESLAKRKRALIMWGRNDFEGSKALLGELISQSEKTFPAVHADALFTLARITENEGNFEEAEKKFKNFVQLYPQDDKVNEALSETIVIAAIQKQSDEALTAALNLIERETRKISNDRDTATLPMALYWAGKIYYEKDQKKKAEFFWQRLAQEFYSTFYGALGQLALEKMNNKVYFLPPMQVPVFSRAEMLKDFQKNDRAILDRAENLLSGGLKAEAACEINEIPLGPNSDHRLLAKAIFQYASGDWLAAVKSYQNLSKAYRVTLPKGMERILFPRSFASLIDHYSKKLGVDPHYVNAIIRQESVFNPKAQSPVGARGLMQMMPGTARLEAKALSPHYVDPGKGGLVSGAIADEKNLSDPETNVMLGVHHVNRLLQKYKHPVFVLTSYNANPRATERWLSTIDSSDLILFIERIPYKETRSYVKLVMRNYFYYKRWYEGPQANMALMEALLPSRLISDSKQTAEMQTSMR
ncbi:MAG: transglycosylase SLT domain-containing protein [Chitinophagaceae bacterium]|nr:transglycosylase SLT domain-containing protein [Oligoflexus sp.]